MSDSASRRRLARLARLLVLFTDDERLKDPIAAAEALPRGSFVVVRARDAVRRRTLALALREVARRRGLYLVIGGDAGLARALGADGVHLPEADIGRAAAIKARGHLLVTAAAHSLGTLMRAGSVDALILSAVFATKSHPGRPALGAARANLMARQMPVAVFALGGITAQNAPRLSGFDGIAAIGALASEKG